MLHYPFAVHGLAVNLLVARPFVGLAADGPGRDWARGDRPGGSSLAGMTGLAYVSAAPSSNSTAALVFLVPFLYGTIANSIIFAVDTILRNRKHAREA